MNFPTIHTNFWDAVIALPLVLCLTQLLKIYLHIPKQWVPSIALAIGIVFSVLISHRGSLTAGLFMGYFYGYAAIGTYASLKTSYQFFRNRK
ncbi:hypothetical protein [Cytobacillus purgationiresistens]|uniref:Holin n=1 Tax=Cytobacillus purgationiresistens TaxID=863449 RepID=A0ABU0AFR1_9BACI|nr:hypothetical protein [Cytobacillus purgationiresistens]MDQ0269704.1 hypothetical protein [Cytobacillus purgationiresistens]